MIRVKADDELLDIPTDNVFTAFKMAGILRPAAIVVSDTTGGRHELTDDVDPLLYTGDRVAHWGHPGETGEIVETETPLRQPRFHWVQWADGFDPVAYLANSLTRVTDLKG